MKLINPEKLIEEKGFFIEDECGCMICVVAAQDIRNAATVDAATPAVPGHTDQYNISEMSYKNGYAKGYEDGKNSGKHGHWIIRSVGHGAHANNWAECSECHVCGSPMWKVCPVCETRMEKHSAINIKEFPEIDFDYAAEDDNA